MRHVDPQLLAGPEHIALLKQLSLSLEDDVCDIDTSLRQGPRTHLFSKNIREAMSRSLLLESGSNLYARAKVLDDDEQTNGFSDDPYNCRETWFT